MADTRVDTESVGSPLSTITKLQKHRASSQSLTDFKFQGRHGGRKREEKSPAPSLRKRSVEEDIKRHIAEVRAKKSQNIKRTMV